MSALLFAFGLNEASTLIKVSFCENLFSLLNALVRLFLVSQPRYAMSMSLHRLGEDRRDALLASDWSFPAIQPSHWLQASP